VATVGAITMTAAGDVQDTTAGIVSLNRRLWHYRRLDDCLSDQKATAGAVYLTDSMRHPD
jgi:hypothetical protein